MRAVNLFYFYCTRRVVVLEIGIKNIYVPAGVMDFFRVVWHRQIDSIKSPARKVRRKKDAPLRLK